MSVQVTIIPEYDATAIVEATGFAITDAMIRDDQLIVEGPTQQQLDDALAAYVATHDSVYLPQCRELAKDLIDGAAGEARRRHITSVPGQAETYAEKGEEAADYVAAGYPAPTGSPPEYVGYPFIQAEVEATGKTSTQAADDILAQKSAWITIGAAIEKERIGGKTNVDAASDVASIESIRDAAVAALDAI